MRQDHINQDHEESEFTLLSLIPGVGLLIRFWFWILLQWRAVRIQCARAWFYYQRGQLIRRERDRQHRSVGVMAGSARKIKESPAVIADNYRRNRAWLFTTISGTIGIILLFLLFWRHWWDTSESVADIEEPDNNTANLLYITDLPADGADWLTLQLKPYSIVRPELDELFVERTGTMLQPLYRTETGDVWVAWKERTPVAPAIVETETPPLNFYETEPTVKFDPPESEPYLSLELPEDPEPVEKVTVKFVYPEGSSAEQNPDYFTILVINEGTKHLTEKMIEDRIPADYQLARYNRDARIDQGSLFWMVRDLAPGDRREIRIEKRPVEKEPSIELKPEPVIVREEPIKESPKLTVKVNQPERVERGAVVPIEFWIRNAGRERVTDIALQTVLPPELEYPRGRDLTLRIPALNPGETRSFRLTTTATRTGKGSQKTRLSNDEFELALQSKIEVIKQRPKSTKSKPTPLAPAPANEPQYYVNPMPWQNPCCYQRTGLMWYGPRFMVISEETARSQSAYGDRRNMAESAMVIFLAYDNETRLLKTS
ncbi:MAG: hypothetical protein R3C11_19860 [Planctomycetaceae bacterium]